MNRIKLHGSLAKHFGQEFEMDVSTAREAFIALCSQLPGFEAKVRKGAFRVVRRSPNGHRFGLDEVSLDLAAINCTIEIYPAVVGGKSTIGKVLIGIAIIGLAIVAAPGAIAAIGAGGASFGAAMSAGIGFLGITYGGIAAVGVMMAIGGIAMMFAPSPKAQSGKAAKDDSSFVLQGPVNTPMQGVVVPLVYGQWLAGSVTISSEITIAQLIGQGGNYDASTSWSNSGYPSYPGATIGVGGTGTSGTRTMHDVAMVSTF